jgi:hypothetical protein
MDAGLLDDPRQYECLRTRKTVVRITVSRVRIPPSRHPYFFALIIQGLISYFGYKLRACSHSVFTVWPRSSAWLSRLASSGRPPWCSARPP